MHKLIILIYLLTPLTTLLSESITTQNSKTSLSVFKKCAPKKSTYKLVDLNTNKTLINFNSNLKLKPASIQKLITSHAVFEKEDIEFKFETKFYEYNNKKDNFLIVKGFGDPSIREKELWEIAHLLKRRVKNKITRLILDDTSFLDHFKYSGERAYETGASAISINYNSVMLEVCPSKANSNAKIFFEPSELDYKLTGKIKTQGGFGRKINISKKGSRDFSYTFGGYVGSKRECEPFFRSAKDPLSYFGLLLGNYLQYLDMAGDLKIEKNSINSYPSFKIKEIYVHKSKPLYSQVKDLHYYSNNMLAEHILMLLGNGNENYSRLKGISYIENMLTIKGFSLNDFEVKDASGLSHDNKLTANIISTTLADSYKNVNYKFEYILSLPIAGKQGTLKDRFKEGSNFKGSVIRAKTGSLTGVSSLAGYILNNNKTHAFVMIQNGTVNKNIANRCEEQALLKLF